MAGGGDGFVGRCEVVEPQRRGKWPWSNEMKALIVAQSLQPAVRVVDVAVRYDILPHHLGDWRCHARQGRLALPGDPLTTAPSSALAEPAFARCSFSPIMWISLCFRQQLPRRVVKRLPILIATKPVDFRCGHNALVQIVQTELKLPVRY